MPPLLAGTWSVDIEKYLNGEYWTNRYIVATADLVSATTVAAQLVAAERAIHFETVLFTKYRVSDGQPETDVYQVVNNNQFGLGVISTQKTLPLFNVMRVDFSTVGGGRPSRKYYRLPISENHQDDGKFTQAALDYFNPLVAAFLDVDAYVDVDNQPFNVASIYPFVGMRQLRRASKRPTTP